MGRTSILGLLAALLSGCSSVPDVSYTYYPAKVRVTALVTETVQCDATGTKLYLAQTPSLSTTYSSRADTPLTVRVKDVEGIWGWAADTKMTLGFYDDGRLKTINQNTTGQGEAIAKSALQLAASALLAGGAEKSGVRDEDACKVIIGYAGAGKPVTLTYSAQIDPPTDPVDLKTISLNTHELKPTEGSISADAALRSVLPVLKVAIAVLQDDKDNTVLGSKDESGTVPLEMRQTLVGSADITSHGASIGLYPVQLPTDTPYWLPIPRAALFGNQDLQVTLSEAGAIQSINYGKTTGTAAALNVINGAVSAAGPVGETANLKARADLIAQQQRLVACEADPTSCK